MANVIATIEITLSDDGSITVSKEADESGDDEGAGSNQVKAKNLDDALSIARSMAQSVSAGGDADAGTPPAGADPMASAPSSASMAPMQKPAALTLKRPAIKSTRSTPGAISMR